MVTEDEFINIYLKPLSEKSKGSLNFTDDAAILPVNPDKDLIVSKDMLLAGQHFFEDDAPADIAHKALAVNLSDIAAKGATPHSFMLAIAFPKAPTEQWASEFTKSLHDLSNSANCPLMGGDTTGTKGPLTLSITIFGEVEKGRMITRSGAKEGDQIYVTGNLGDAAFGYEIRKTNGAAYQDLLSSSESKTLLARYLRPTPRLILSEAIKQNASAAMDISDGLISDLKKLCRTSCCGAEITLANIPFSEPVQKIITSNLQARDYALGWGDDYEILCTVPPANVAEFEKKSERLGAKITNIGAIKAQNTSILYKDENGQQVMPKPRFFEHF